MSTMRSRLRIICSSRFQWNYSNSYRHLVQQGQQVCVYCPNCIAQGMQDECHLITDTSLYKLKRTQHQNMNLVVESEPLLIKANTQTILRAHACQPQYHEIYRYIKTFALNSYEMDLDTQPMFTVKEIQDRFLVSCDQLRMYLESIPCYYYKGRLYHFDENTHISLFRLITMVVMELKLDIFKLEQLQIKDQLMQEFVSGTLKFYQLGVGDGSYQLKFQTIARSVLAELLLQKAEYNFSDLWEAFWMMIPTYYDFDKEDLHEVKEILFQNVCKLQSVIIDTNIYQRPIKDFNGFVIRYDFIIQPNRRIDKKEIANESLERMRSLKQPRFLPEQINDWLLDAGRTPKEVGEFIQRHFKSVSEQVHPSNVDKISQVYPQFDGSKTIKFLVLKS